MFHRKTLNTAVAAAMAGLGAVSSNVLADAAFFPHVVVSDTVTTIVSVINTTNDLYDVTGQRIPWNARTGQGFLHYRMYYKDAASLDDPCEELNVNLPTSANDLQTIDLGASDNSGVLFEPPVNPIHPPVVQWAGYDYALGSQARAMMPAGTALRGYLLVDNAESDGGVYLNDEPTVFGEAVVVEFGVGATWGYHAFSKQDDSQNVEQVPDYDNEFDFEDAASISGYPLAFMPFEGAEGVSSGLMVTALIHPGTNRENGVPGWPDSDMSENPNINKVSLYLTTHQSPANWGSSIGIYDRDEVPVSGGIIEDVTCVGRVSIHSLVNDNVRLAEGGWGRLRNSAVVTYASTIEVSPGNTITTTGTVREYDAAVIYKLEYGALLNGLDIGGTWNNAFLIPNDYEVYSD